MDMVDMDMVEMDVDMDMDMDMVDMMMIPVTKLPRQPTMPREMRRGAMMI